MKNDGVVELKIVKKTEQPGVQYKNERILATLNNAIVEAQRAGWTEVCVTFSKPFGGYQSMCTVEEGDDAGGGRGSMVYLVGALNMSLQFAQDIASGRE